MSTTTSWLAIPVPEATDPPNGPTQILAVANRVDAIVPKLLSAGGAITTSSASLVDVTGGGVTVTSASGGVVEFAVFASISPSGAGDAKVNLSIDGVDYGQIMQVNAGGSASTPRWMQPGSTTGNAMAGCRFLAFLGAGSKVIKTRALSTSGSATFGTTLLVWQYKG